MKREVRKMPNPQVINKTVLENLREKRMLAMTKKVMMVMMKRRRRREMKKKMMMMMQRTTRPNYQWACQEHLRTPRLRLLLNW